MIGLEDVPVDRPPRTPVAIHYCSSAQCPGFPYRASEIPHPPDICRDSVGLRHGVVMG